MTAEELLGLKEQTEAAAQAVSNNIRQLDDEIESLHDHRNELQRQLIFINGRLSLIREMLEPGEDDSGKQEPSTNQ